MGSDFWEERMSLNETYSSGFLNLYNSEKAAFFAANRTQMNQGTAAAASCTS